LKKIEASLPFEIRTHAKEIPHGQQTSRIAKAHQSNKLIS
jgi:hypothetical protein